MQYIGTTPTGAQRTAFLVKDARLSDRVGEP